MDTDVCSQETSVCDIWSRRVNSVTRNNHDVISVSMRSNSGASQKDPTGYAGRHRGSRAGARMEKAINFHSAAGALFVSDEAFTSSLRLEKGSISDNPASGK